MSNGTIKKIINKKIHVILATNYTTTSKKKKKKNWDTWNPTTSQTHLQLLSLILMISLLAAPRLSPILTNFMFGSLEFQWNYCDLFCFTWRMIWPWKLRLILNFSLKLLQVGMYKQVSKSILSLFLKFVMYFYSFSHAL